MVFAPKPAPLMASSRFEPGDPAIRRPDDGDPANPKNIFRNGPKTLDFRGENGENSFATSKKAAAAKTAKPEKKETEMKTETVLSPETVAAKLAEFEKNGVENSTPEIAAALLFLADVDADEIDETVGLGFFDELAVDLGEMARDPILKAAADRFEAAEFSASARAVLRLAAAGEIR